VKLPLGARLVRLKKPRGKGIVNKHYIIKIDHAGREYRLHATKGWRNRKA
jgi:hypothetical protein